MGQEANGPQPRLLLVGALGEDPAGYSLEYELIPRLTTEVRHTGSAPRVLRFESEGLKFLGVEVERIEALPEGMVGWELGETTFALYGPAGVEGEAPLEWQWQEVSPGGRVVGEFSTTLPGAGEAQSFWLAANAWLAPAAADNVVLVDYDPDWPAQYQAMASWLREKLSANLVRRLEHIGSTAVPGLAAKPVIDLAMQVPSAAAGRRRVIPLLNRQEWEYWWYADHAVFIRRDPATGRRTHHLHLSPDPHWLRQRLAFRDYLRTHPDEAGRYAALKRELAGSRSQDREAYTDAKAEYVREITARATGAPA